MHELSPQRARMLSVSVLMFIVVMVLFVVLLLLELFDALALQAGSGLGFVLIKIAALIGGIVFLFKVRADLKELHTDKGGKA